MSLLGCLCDFLIKGDKMKRIVALILLMLCVISLVGCGTTYEQAEVDGATEMFGEYFTVVKQWHQFGRAYLLYANDTKVMYIYVEKGYGAGITPLYNADGTLQIYEGPIE
jgi:hypothetical protein